MEKLEHLKLIYHERLRDEASIPEKIKEPNGIYYYVPFLEFVNVVRALYEINVNNDYKKARELFYKAALIPEFMSRKFDWRVIDSGIYQISYALFSDSKDLINTYSVLKNKANNETGIGYQFTNVVQNILLDDWEKVAWNIHCFTRLTKVKSLSKYANILPVLEGFAQKDPDLIRKGLIDYLSTHVKRNSNNELYCNFLSIDTAGFTKLAWIKGYQIDLNSPLVPIKLMPVEPVDTYSGYSYIS
ncbi:hypothetical protein GCM10023149_20280 [Mucilaginibacter gynuensis]|uniref:Immunity protein 49 of polymorphic toxin system n=1 Tax=Mucilaginibacter gynuensis TaxID=1302236 RepID=A0ABP8GAZ4_9SPHI